MAASKYNEALLGPLVASSRTLAEVLRKLGLQPTGGNYRYINSRIRLLGLDKSHFTRSSHAMWLQELTREDLMELVRVSRSVADVLEKLGLPRVGRTHHRLTRRLDELAIDTSHFTGSAWNRGETRYTHPSIERASRESRRSDEDLFIANAPYVNGPVLTRRLLDKGVRYECARCGINEWLGIRLVLHLDHINGINNDNRFENLRLLCPNCHSQTDTYGRRASRSSQASEPRRVLYGARPRAWWNGRHTTFR